MAVHKLYRKYIRIQEQLLTKHNRPVNSDENALFTRYQFPVLTDKHVPIEWKYDISEETNPFFLERLGINSVFNSGAIFIDGKYYLMARVEGKDRKSFFAVAESNSPTERFRFCKEPVYWDDTDLGEVNVYDIRLTKHEDGFIYGIYCSESKDPNAPFTDTSMAIAKASVLRTKDLVTFEKLPDIVTPSAQQRNVALHPEYVNGKYMLYTRPQDGFIETGGGGGIAYGFIDTFDHPTIEIEYLLDEKKYHTIYELKNGVGPSPIKTKKGWIHFAHGVRNTASGLRYVLYCFATSLEDPTKVIAKPSGYLMSPTGEERIGDVSNVLFTNGVIVNEFNEVFLYYGSSDTRLHVAKTTINKLIDYVFNTPSEVFRSRDSVIQRLDLIHKNIQERKS